MRTRSHQASVFTPRGGGGCLVLWVPVGIGLWTLVPGPGLFSFGDGHFEPLAPSELSKHRPIPKDVGLGHEIDGQQKGGGLFSG